MSPFTATILNLLFTEAEQKGKTRFFLDVHWIWIRRSKFNPWDSTITFQARMAFDEQDSLHAVRSIRNLVHVRATCGLTMTKRSILDRCAVNESDAPLCERPHLWLDPTKLEILSRIAEKHEQVNTDCNGASVRDW